MCRVGWSKNDRATERVRQAEGERKIRIQKEHELKESIGKSNVWK